MQQAEPMMLDVYLAVTIMACVFLFLVLQGAIASEGFKTEGTLDEGEKCNDNGCGGACKSRCCYREKCAPKSFCYGEGPVPDC